MLISAETETVIQLLIDTREINGVSLEKVFIFAAQTRKPKKALRGSKRLSALIGQMLSLQRPDLIKSTPLSYINYYHLVVKSIYRPCHKKVNTNTKYFFIFLKIPVTSPRSLRYTRIQANLNHSGYKPSSDISARGFKLFLELSSYLYNPEL